MSDLSTAATTSLDTLKALVPLAGPAIKAAIDTWLVPGIQSVLKNKAFKKNTKPDHVSVAFEEYLIRTYARLSFMNTIVFGNQQRRIQDLYIPLTVRSSREPNTLFEINQWREDFIPAFKRVVITDTAGMGKSTILKWLFLCSIGTSKGIPIFVELRTLTSGKTLLDKIYEDLCPVDKPFNKELLLHLIKTGQFIFFLDGFDEVAFEDRKSVTEDIQAFIGKAINNLFVLASRHETALGSFGEFREFTIKPLSKLEAYSLLRKYDDTSEHAQALIDELDASKYEQLKDLMINPMLVSLLFKAYSYKPKVPFKKQIFYRQVFDALFDMHDSTKGGAFVRKKNSNLDIDEFHTIMRDLGFTTAKLGKIEYEKDVINEIIKKVRERNTSILFQPSALLKDLVTTVPLFNKEGEHYKWAHKSVQDYFASQYIALDTKGNEDALLAKIYDGGHARRFENILDMLHDTDNSSFRRVLLARVLRDYITHYDNSYLGDFGLVSAEAIEERKQLTFGIKQAFTLLSQKDMPKLFTKDFDKFVDKAFNKIFEKGEGLNRMLFIGGQNLYLIQLAEFYPSHGMLPMLVARKYSYITKAKADHWDDDAIGKLPQGGAFLVTDNPACPLNSVKTFEVVNGLLRGSGFRIEISDVRRTLKSIQDEAVESAQVDFLMQDL